MKKIILLLLCFLPWIQACQQSNQQSESQPLQPLDPDLNASELETDFRTWWNYHSSYIELSSDFKALDENSSNLSKKETLEKLTKGQFIPLRLKSQEGVPLYQLYPLSDSASASISRTIKSQGLTSLKHYRMEGQPFPDFEMTDLEGNRYTNASILGKTILVKTWFINCKACIEEFPELNAFVDKHQDQDDLMFLGLALDAAPALQNFLSRNEFKYKVIPNQKEMIGETLNAQIFPTHFLINKKGIVQKVENQASKILKYYNQSKTEGKPPYN